MKRARLQSEDLSLPKGFANRLDLAQAATPRLLKKHPIHRWLWFPHSYSPELVEAILNEWDLPKDATLLDPFVGAGTTLLVARQRGLSALGIDLSPLAVWISNTKARSHSPRRLQALAERVFATIDNDLKREDLSPKIPSKRLARAFTLEEYATLQAIEQSIVQEAEGEADFFRLALLGVLPRFSRAVRDGGWFRWVERPDQSEAILPAFKCQVKVMLDDLLTCEFQPPKRVRAVRHDARRAHKLNGEFDAVITSPPYPNRHDYSRAFHIELLWVGCTEEDIFDLRYSSLRSHVEARPVIKNTDGYREPECLAPYLQARAEKGDRRVPSMIRGYFEDLYLTLRSMAAMLRPGAKLAFVVGNVSHSGVMFLVDEILAEVGEQAGYEWIGTWLIRLRGNSAQQMDRYGRIPSRESIVFFEKRG